jgi:hypothetical protein
MTSAALETPVYAESCVAKGQLAFQLRVCLHQRANGKLHVTEEKRYPDGRYGVSHSRLARVHTFTKMFRLYIAQRITYQNSTKVIANASDALTGANQERKTDL